MDWWDQHDRLLPRSRWDVLDESFNFDRQTKSDLITVIMLFPVDIFLQKIYFSKIFRRRNYKKWEKYWQLSSVSIKFLKAVFIFINFFPAFVGWSRAVILFSHWFIAMKSQFHMGVPIRSYSNWWLSKWWKVTESLGWKIGEHHRESHHQTSADKNNCCRFFQSRQRSYMI